MRICVQCEARKPAASFEQQPQQEGERRKRDPICSECRIKQGALFLPDREVDNASGQARSR